jgi:hypothetical protein
MATILEIHFVQVLEVSVGVICLFSKPKTAIEDHLKMHHNTCLYKLYILGNAII